MKIMSSSPPYLMYFEFQPKYYCHYLYYRHKLIASIAENMLKRFVLKTSHAFREDNRSNMKDAEYFCP